MSAQEPPKYSVSNIKTKFERCLPQRHDEATTERALLVRSSNKLGSEL